YGAVGVGTGSTCTSPAFIAVDQIACNVGALSAGQQIAFKLTIAGVASAVSVSPNGIFSVPASAPTVSGICPTAAAANVPGVSVTITGTGFGLSSADLTAISLM